MQRFSKLLTHLIFSSLLWTVALSWPLPCPASSPSILPDGLTISGQFKPGYGAPVGKMLLTQGPVIVVHQGISSGFHIEGEKPLFKGDTIYTDKKARARFRLDDGSIMTLSSQTKLTINKSIYDPQKKQRTSFLSLALGKARFLVTKMFQFQKTSFKVKSGTFVAGVRGSDFIISQIGEKTSVTALEKTTLEVMRMDAPEMKPVLLSSFQRTIGSLGGRLQEPQNIPPQEIELLKQEFSLPDDPGRASDSDDSRADQSKSKEEKQAPKSDEHTAAGKPLRSGEMQGMLPVGGISDDTEIQEFLIPDDELENPDFGAPELNLIAEPPELPPNWDVEKPEPDPPETPELDEELPGFPGLPQ